MNDSEMTTVDKVCAYITRSTPERELLVFEGPEYDGLQVPKGTIESDETPFEALYREVREESGLTTLRSVRHLITDRWLRRRSPPKQYRRHFFHACVDDPREEWTHVVTGDGEERGLEFEYTWTELPPDEEFVLALDDYVDLVDQTTMTPAFR